MIQLNSKRTCRDCRLFGPCHARRTVSILLAGWPTVNHGKFSGLELVCVALAASCLTYKSADDEEST